MRHYEHAHITIVDSYHSGIQSNAFAEIMLYPKAHRKTGTKKRNVTHAKLLTGPLVYHNLKHVKPLHPRRQYQKLTKLTRKKSERKRSSTNSCTQTQGTKTAKQSGNNASDVIM